MFSHTKNITGAFIQAASILEWTPTQYDMNFRRYKELNFDHLIIPACEISTENKINSYYPTIQKNRVIIKDLYTPLFEYASKYKIKLFVSSRYNELWFEKITRPNEEFIHWFNNEIDTNIHVCNELYQMYKKYNTKDFKAFGGWYITYEVDNLNFMDKGKQVQYAKSLNILCNTLHKISWLPIMIAPFFNRTLLPPHDYKGWKTIWSNILKYLDIDIFALQDGIGCLNETEDPLKSRNQAMKNINKWLKSTKEAIKASGKEISLWTDLETFEQYFEGDNSFKAKPAPLDRIIKQIKTESPYVDKITSFSLHEYQNFNKYPIDYKNYQNYLHSK